MARFRQNKPNSSILSATSQSSIAHKRSHNILRSAPFGKGRKGKDLRLISRVLPVPPTPPRELDEDSGFGNEASSDADLSSSKSKFASQAATTTFISPVSKNCNATFLKRPSTSDPNNVSNSVSVSTSAEAAPPSIAHKNSLCIESFNKSLTTAAISHKNLIAIPVSSQYLTAKKVETPRSRIRIKRGFNMLSNSADPSLAASASFKPISLNSSLQNSIEVDPLKPPAKKQATLKKKAALNVKRLTFLKSPQVNRQKQIFKMPSLVHLSDEATQELPGEMNSSASSGSSKSGVPQLLTFTNLPSAGIQFNSSHLSSSTNLQTLTPFFGLGIVSNQSPKKEKDVCTSDENSDADSKGAKNLSNAGPIFLSIIRSDATAKSDNEVPSAVEKSPSSPCETFTNDNFEHSGSPIHSSELTNLCGNLSLSQEHEIHATDFRSYNALLTKDETDGKIGLEILNLNAKQENPSETLLAKCIDGKDLADDKKLCQNDSADEAEATDESQVVEEPVKPLAISLSESLPSVSSDGKIRLLLVKQPEKQHRARYLTEGSRGAVKDEEGTGHPIVEITGCSTPCTMQVFVGCDSGNVVPHVYYQACQVTSKTVDDIKEEKINGTSVIEVPVTPLMDMRLSCDCVGILKERHVDVEQRRGQYIGPCGGKNRRTTKCRLVFRATVKTEEGNIETLQVVSQPISCTQPPGMPEITRKSISQCQASEQPEMYLIGKHFQKDSKVVFIQEKSNSSGKKSDVLWKKVVTPEAEFYNSTHLVCKVPKYDHRPIQPNESVEVAMKVLSAGKYSESQSLTFLPDKLAEETLFSFTTSANEADQGSKHSICDGISEDAIRINEEFAATGKFTLQSKLASPVGQKAPCEVTSSPKSAVSVLLRDTFPQLQAMSSDKLELVRKMIKQIANGAKISEVKHKTVSDINFASDTNFKSESQLANIEAAAQTKNVGHEGGSLDAVKLDPLVAIKPHVMASRTSQENLIQHKELMAVPTSSCSMESNMQQRYLALTHEPAFSSDSAAKKCRFVEQAMHVDDAESNTLASSMVSISSNTGNIYRCVVDHGKDKCEKQNYHQQVLQGPLKMCGNKFIKSSPHDQSIIEIKYEAVEDHAAAEEHIEAATAPNVQQYIQSNESNTAMPFNNSTESYSNSSAANSEYQDLQKYFGPTGASRGMNEILPESVTSFCQEKMAAPSSSVDYNRDAASSTAGGISFQHASSMSVADQTMLPANSFVNSYEKPESNQGNANQQSVLGVNFNTAEGSYESHEFNKMSGCSGLVSGELSQTSQGNSPLLLQPSQGALTDQQSSQSLLVRSSQNSLVMSQVSQNSSLVLQPVPLNSQHSQNVSTVISQPMPIILSQPSNSAFLAQSSQSHSILTPQSCGNESQPSLLTQSNQHLEQPMQTLQPSSSSPLIASDLQNTRMSTNMFDSILPSQLSNQPIHQSGQILEQPQQNQQNLVHQLGNANIPTQMQQQYQSQSVLLENNAVKMQDLCSPLQLMQCNVSSGHLVTPQQPHQPQQDMHPHHQQISLMEQQPSMHQESLQSLSADSLQESQHGSGLQSQQAVVQRQLPPMELGATSLPPTADQCLGQDSYISPKSPILVGHGDPLLSQVSGSPLSWTTESYSRGTTSSSSNALEQPDPMTSQSSSESFLYM